MAAVGGALRGCGSGVCSDAEGFARRLRSPASMDGWYRVRSGDCRLYSVRSGG